MTDIPDRFEEEDGYANEFTAPAASEQVPSPESQGMPPAIDIPELVHETSPVEEPLFRPEQPHVNFTAERKANGTPREGEDPILSYVCENFATLNKVLERNNELLTAMRKGQLTNTDIDIEWLATLITGLNNISLDAAPTGALSRGESHWRDGISTPSSDKLLRPGRPAQKYDRNKRHSKEDALAYLSYRSGMGGTYETFLPHSGIWVRLRRPSLGEIVAMQTELQAIRVKLGNDTKGLAFSHASFRMLDAITDLAVSCITASNRQYKTPTDLEDEISIFDESILHHALAAVMFPDGFNYSVPCIADPKNCSGVTKFKMNMSNVVWYDDAVFTTDQRKHIAKKFQAIPLEEFEAYRKSFSIGAPKVFWMGEIGIKLAPPSVAERRVAAKLWYETLIEMSQGAFNESPDGNQRFDYIRRLQQATKATQYSHWVSAIYIKDDDATDFEDQLFTEDHEIIMEFISSTVSEHEYFDTFVEKVNSYSNESIIGVVALPSHNCEVCNTPQGLTFNERLPHLVPMDMLATFFTLAARKVLQQG
jgi:hypothetical protein